MLKRLQEKGDTIVEVMVVLAVLGLALSISYATANRSLLDTRQAQENAHATELVRSQIEMLRTIACSSNVANDVCSEPPNLRSSTAVYCFKEGEKQLQLGVTNPNCKLTLGDVPYTISVRYTASDSRFTVKAEWDSVQGQMDAAGNPQKDSVTMSYRLPR